VPQRVPGERVDRAPPAGGAFIWFKPDFPLHLASLPISMASPPHQRHENGATGYPAGMVAQSDWRQIVPSYKEAVAGALPAPADIDALNGHIPDRRSAVSVPASP